MAPANEGGGSVRQGIGMGQPISKLNKTTNSSNQVIIIAFTQFQVYTNSANLPLP